MPNKRAAHMVVTSLSLPRDLLDKVRAKAASESPPRNVSSVIRTALEHYVRSPK